MKRSTHEFVLSLAISFVLFGTTGVAAGNEAVARLSRYVQINTVNPPGNEIESAHFFAKIFEAAGIDYEIAKSAPGRGNIWARLSAADPDSALPGIVLLHHMDVVSASSGHWDLPPFSGETRDGYLYGRGTLDTKGLGIVQLQAFLALADSGMALNRDVLFLATADEEAGGNYGAGWLVRERPELFANMGFLVNEGGGGRDMGNGKQMFSIEVTQKVPLWLRLTASGRPGHGSAPQVETAVTRLVHAAGRILDTVFPVRVIEPVDTMFRGMADFHPDPQQRTALKDIATAAKQPGFLRAFQASEPTSHALLRNTCSMTRLSASDKINVVPPEASLELDCRLLPDQSPEVFREELLAIVDDPDIRMETLLSFAPAISPADTELFRAIELVTARYYPGAPVVPGVVGGFTDSHFFREIGIVSYGYSPMVVPISEFGGVHGNNERVGVEVFTQGIQVMTDLLSEFTTAH